jgi:hypothetical protein
MDKDIPFYVIDNMIFVIRKHFYQFKNDVDDITEQLQKIEKMRLARIPDKYILKSLLEDNNIIIRSIEKLDENNIVREIKDKIKELENS